MEEKATPTFNVDINVNLQLKRYPVHKLNNNNDIVNKHGILPKNHKMDFYIYKLNKHITVAYLSLAKCASNEIRDIFNNLTWTKIAKKLEINVKNKNDRRLKNMIIFSFIRNPWERFHSAFNMMMGKTSLELPNEFLKFTEDPDSSKKMPYKYVPGHWTPQYDQLITENGEILPKYIGNINDLYPYIENMINDLSMEQNTKTRLINKLIKLKNEKKKTHVRNKNFNDNSYYLKYYNKKTYNNVAKYLETDIKLFNFKNNLNVLKN